MQTLGVSDSTPRTESRIKALFWPSVQSGTDVDYLGVQGYWVCTFVAALSLLALMFARMPIVAVVVGLFFYLGGVGVRERSQFAAIMVFTYLFADTILTMNVSVVRVLLLALLLSNVRATWIAAVWVPGSDEAALPPRLNETFSDKFADQLPQWLWPKVRIVFYVGAILLILLTILGLATTVFRNALQQAV